MSIRPIGTPSTAPRPAAPAPPRPAAPATPAAPAESATGKAKAGGPPDHAKAYGYRARQDSVVISQDARSRAAAGAPVEDGVHGGPEPLSAERVAELRKKVLEGAYNQAGVVDQVAKRLLSTGDV
jgi:hypothetical protein